MEGHECINKRIITALHLCPSVESLIYRLTSKNATAWYMVSSYKSVKWSKYKVAAASTPGKVRELPAQDKWQLQSFAQLARTIVSIWIVTCPSETEAWRFNSNACALRHWCWRITLGTSRWKGADEASGQHHRWTQLDCKYSKLKHGIITPSYFMHWEETKSTFTISGECGFSHVARSYDINKIKSWIKSKI